MKTLCKLCGTNAAAFGCYETCTFNGPLHEWEDVNEGPAEEEAKVTHRPPLPAGHAEVSRKAHEVDRLGIVRGHLRSGGLRQGLRPQA